MSGDTLRDVFDVMGLVVESETAVAEYYAACSKAFPENLEFRGSLAKEETHHAKVINKPAELVGLKPHEFEAARSCLFMDFATLSAEYARILKR